MTLSRKLDPTSYLTCVQTRLNTASRYLEYETTAIPHPMLSAVYSGHLETDLKLTNLHTYIESLYTSNIHTELRENRPS